MKLSLAQQTLLTPNDSDAPSYLIKLVSNQPLDYQAGDWVTLKGQNPPYLVNQILERLALKPDQLISLRRQGEISVAQALTHHLELTLLDPAILNKLVRQHGFNHWSDRSQMQAYAQGRDVLDLLLAFPDLQQWGVDFLTLLGPLAPRYYSIASSPLGYPNQIHLLYKAIRYQRDNRERIGVSSGWMAQAQVGDLFDVEIKPNKHFKLPDDPSTPIVMLAAGTGLAPFIGFLQQREAQGARGRNLLYFGETHRQSRFLCQAELEGWQAQGLLELDTAFSRDQSEKIYVQNRLLANQTWLAAWESGANIYICGDKIKLAQSLEQQIKAIWMQNYRWQEEQADQTWLEAKQQKRIQMDVY
jgi:sulfite reductase (NADPH) flavoprotein alpha-component